MGPAVAAIGRSLASLLAVGGNVSNGLTKLTGAMKSLDTGLGGALTNFTHSIKQDLKDTTSLWKDYNDQATKNVRQIGLSVKNVNAYQKEMMVGFKHLTAEYGITIDQLLKQQQSVSDATQKARILGQEDLKNLAAMNKLIGEQATQESIRNFDRLGGSLETATAHMAKTWGMARRYGLNAQQASESFAKNIKLAESYTFANGIQGIAKMTLLSQKLKFDMEGVAKAAESNFGSVESAIESSAKLQMLGGNMGAMFSNPMDALYESINDMEGFTERVIAGASQRGFFNAKTGTFEMNGLDKMFLKEQAKALGMSYNDLFQMASQSSTNKYIEGQLKGNFTEEQKAYVTSNAQYDTDKQKHYITRFNPITNKNEKVYVENLTASLVAQMQDMAAPEQIMQNDVADIKNMLMDYFHTSAQDLVSLRERETGIKEGFNTAKAEAIDWAMRPYQGIVNDFAKGGFYRWLLDHPGLVLTGGLVGSGLGGAWRGIKNKFFGPETPPNVGDRNTRTVSNAFGAKGGTNGLARTTRVSLAQVQEMKGAEQTSRWSKTKNAAKKAGSKVKSAWGKMGKGGKAALIAGGALLLGSLFAGGGKEEAEPTEEGFEGGPGIEGGQDLLLELQKHTVLLEKIAGGVNAEELHAKKYGSQSGPEGQEYGLLDKTMDTAGMTVLPMMAADSVRNHIIGRQTGHSAKVVARTRSIKALQSGGKQVANIAGKAGLKMGAKTAGTLVKAGMKAPGVGMIADLGNLAGQSLGLWKEGSFADKALSTVGDAGTGAMIGGMILPGVGHVIGGIIGGTVGVVRNFGKDIAKGVKSVAKKAWSGIKSVGKGIANFFGFGGEKEEEIKKKMELPEFETKKFGETAIDDPKLFEKAALSVISIHDFLISKLGDKNNAVVAEAKSKAAGALGILGGGLGVAGGAIGGLLGGAGSAIGSVARGAGSLIKNVVTAPFKFIGGLLGIGGDENAEAKATNPEELSGEPLMEMAARATIDIKETLNKIYVGGSVLFSNSLFGRGSGLASRIPELTTGGILSTGIANSITPRPIGEGWFNRTVESVFNPLGTTGTGEGGIAPIDVNVNGTIKLDLGNNGSLNIDARKLLENKEFVDKIISMVSDAFQRNVAMGAGANRSNPARYGIGNTDVIAGRRR